MLFFLSNTIAIVLSSLVLSGDCIDSEQVTPMQSSECLSCYRVVNPMMDDYSSDYYWLERAREEKEREEKEREAQERENHLYAKGVF